MKGMACALLLQLSPTCVACSMSSASLHISLFRPGICNPHSFPFLTLLLQGITNGAVLTAVRRVLVADGWKVRPAVLCCAALCCAASNHSAPPPPCSALRCQLLRPAPPIPLLQIHPVDDDGYASTSDEDDEEAEDAWDQKFDEE